MRYTGTLTKLHHTNTAPNNSFVFIHLWFVAINLFGLKFSNNRQNGACLYLTIMCCLLAVISHNKQYYRLRLALLYQGQSDEPFGRYCNWTFKWHAWIINITSDHVLLRHNIPNIFHTFRSSLTFRLHASCILGQSFHYSTENAFYIFNQQMYFIIWYLLDRASLKWII